MERIKWSIYFESLKNEIDLDISFKWLKYFSESFSAISQNEDIENKWGNFYKIVSLLKLEMPLYWKI